MFIFGFPSDTNESIEANIKFAKSLRTHFAQFSVFTPYPGTPAYEEYKDKISVQKYEDFTQWRLVYRHNTLTNDKIRYYLNKAYTEYYISPLLFLKWLKVTA